MVGEADATLGRTHCGFDWNGNTWFLTCCGRGRYSHSCVCKPITSRKVYMHKTNFTSFLLSKLSKLNRNLTPLITLVSTGSPKLPVLYHVSTKTVSARAKIPSTDILVLWSSDLKGQIWCFRNDLPRISRDLILLPGIHTATPTLIDTFLSSTHGLLFCLISSWGQEWFRIGLFFKNCLFTKGPHLACLETTTLHQETRDLAWLIFWVINCACSWSPAFWQGLPCLSYAHRTPKDFLLFVILGGIHQDPALSVLPLGTQKAVPIIPTFCLYPLTSELTCYVTSSSNRDYSNLSLSATQKTRQIFSIFCYLFLIFFRS